MAKKGLDRLIQSKRRDLRQAVRDRGSLVDQEVLKKSRELDKLVVEYMRQEG